MCGKSKQKVIGLTLQIKLTFLNLFLESKYANNRFLFDFEPLIIYNWFKSNFDFNLIFLDQRVMIGGENLLLKIVLLFRLYFPSPGCVLSPANAAPHHTPFSGSAFPHNNTFLLSF